MALFLNSAIPDQRQQTLSFIDIEAAKEFDCGICLQIVVDPVDIGCTNGHIYCNVCIARLVVQNRNKREFLCPSCRCVCKLDSIRKMPFIQRQIKKLKIKCTNHEITPRMTQLLTQRNTNNKRVRDREQRKKSRCCITVPQISETHLLSRSRSRERNTTENTQQINKDDTEPLSFCEWKGSWGDLPHHLTQCPYEIICCQYCEYLCIRKESEEHSAICSAYPLHCNKCNKLVKRAQLNIHLEIACPKVETLCVCGETLLREAQPMHSEHFCPESKLQCLYAMHGCPSVVKRRDMEHHLKSNMEQHLYLVTQQYEYLVNYCQSLSHRLQQIEKRLNLRNQ